MAGPKFRQFLFRQNILLFNKFQGVDFKYDNSFFKILALKNPNKAFLVPNFGIFIFLQNFTII